ncbi:AAA family ATPase [Paenibacillus spongiae]|uniref:AAA family ATPase n=1 Tax=Paenibacillus spongiae TaxID=2909671 RepID=A0ABY5SD92_9BACL|nr:AAA family ATPase [Paenibacillus spongiae]UVI30663.1 AAA family ATPase [Paenibacillus spongiae]
MLELPGYQTIDTIGSSDEISLYRLVRREDGTSVIAKTARREYPGSNLADSFRYEYDILKRLGGRGTAEALSLETIAERPVLLLRDIGGSTLDRILRARSGHIGVAARLSIAAAAVDCLMQIHHERIMLNEITPFQLIVNPDTCEVKWADIRMCSTESDKSPLSLLTDRPDSVLPYISPEQTGRTGLAPDYRSDFYSLGVILYEWLSGDLPFDHQGVPDVVYHHLASEPQPLHHRAPAIPEMVSGIIAKCMEKTPEARYVSAYGIKSDLEECLAQYRAAGIVQSFALAGRDIPDRWEMPARFYGRIAEQRFLQEALQRASDGAVEVVWISGSGGIGKTAFVQETFRRIAPFDGVLAEGKSDPAPTARPYGVWIQAMDEMVSQLLMENKLQAEVWKLRILSAVDGYGQLLIELVPKLELLIGRQPPVQPLPPKEAQHRFHRVLNRFFHLFLHRGRPLVLFLDDLQLADESSLQYLTYLLEDRETKHLLVALAYRDDDITGHHSISRLQKQLAERSTAMSSIRLHALEAADLERLLGDSMRCDAAATDELTPVLLAKTEGNPFFLKRFLQDLVDEKHIAFDDSTRSWKWNLASITEMNVADNAAAYISDKMKHLPERTVHVLGRAAFFGSQFQLDMLFPIAGQPMNELLEALGSAVREGLLQPVGGESMRYKFQHDRIRQAAYALVDEAERLDLHWRIGALLIDRMKIDEEVHIFEAVNHFNQAVESIKRPEQRLELAELNLQAGLKAKQATAYETALGYLRHATALIGEDSWDNRYELAFAVFRERAEMEYLCARFAEANDLFGLLLQKAASNLDKALVYSLMIQLESSKDNYEEVISYGREALRLLDISHNFEPERLQLTMQWLRLSRKIRKHPIDSLHNLPPMTDESRRAAMSVMVHTSNALFFVNLNGWLASSLTMVEMTLEYGMTPEASIGFIAYAIFQYAYFRNYEAAFKWGMFACSLSRSYPTLHVKTLSSFALCFDAWRRYDSSLLETFTEYSGKIGLEAGDLWHGNQSVLINCATLLQYGHPLGKIYDRLIAHAGDLERHNNDLHWKQATITAALLVRLTGYRAPNDPFDPADISRKDFAESVHGDRFNIIQGLVYVLEYLPGYLFGHYREANDALKKTVSAIKESRQAGYEHTVHYTYEVLVRAQLYEEASPKEQRGYWANMRKRLKAMRQHASRCPENYQHKYLLIQAEMARLKRRYRKAVELYEQSIEAARKYGHIHDLAMAAECCGRYGLREGKMQLARIYMTEAYEAYLQWGATAKAADMEQKYGYLLNIRRESGLERFDSLSVVMSAQALSGEMEMDRLLHTLMRIMLHNAGAEYGALIFHHEGRWSLEAYGTAEELRIESVPLKNESELVPAAIVAYAARTAEEVVLHDAAREGMFTRNRYVRNKGLKSVLCLPIMHQSKLICLLYMENRLSTSVFTPQRLEVLKLLGSQCAISIENAKLYSGIQYLNNSLEEQVKERTRSLEQSMRETSAALAEVSIYEERNRIAQEIHDIVGHTLTSTVVQIEAGRRLIHKNAEGASARLKEAQDLVRHSLNEIRGSVHMLKEDRFADLPQMLNQLIQDAQRNTGVVIHAAMEDLPELTTAHKKAIYHALQEGLTNGIRHGGSTEFRFSLGSDGSHVQFRLEDRGMGASSITMGFGLKAMKERAELLGGSLSIDSRPHQGCLLRIDLPYGARVIGDKR